MDFPTGSGEVGDDGCKRKFDAHVMRFLPSSHGPSSLGRPPETRFYQLFMVSTQDGT